MPNWCCSNITFYGDKKEVKDLYDKINLATSDDYKNGIESDFGIYWLGNVVTIFNQDYNKLPCRGMVEDIGEYVEDAYENIDAFNIETTTPWTFNDEMWDSIIQNNYQNVNYVYVAEEPNLEYYMNTDKNGLFYKEKYRIYIFSDDIESVKKYISVSSLSKMNACVFEDNDNEFYFSDLYFDDGEILYAFNNFFITEETFNTIQDVYNFINNKINNDENNNVTVLLYDYFSYMKIDNLNEYIDAKLKDVINLFGE